jgi:hypothetical protein
MSSRVVGLGLVMTFAVTSLRADEPRTAKNTLASVPGAPPPSAKIADVAWIAGHWKGPSRGGVTAEIWSSPMAGTMMAACRLVRDGKLAFYELAAIAEESGSLTLRLKHFHPDLTGWEEKNEALAFPLVKLDKDVAYFDGVTFRKPAGGNLEIFVRIHHKNGQTTEERFPFQPAAEWDRMSERQGR